MTILYFFTFLGKSSAFYDPREVENNKFGVHVLFDYEVEQASKLVNSNNGEWGWLVVPIQSTDRDLIKWQKFMDECKKHRIIPILRIATFAKEDYWTKGHWYEEVDFANFLDSLNWPIENRYVIIYNEPNRANEWGGYLAPEDYARVLSTSYDVFKRVNENFFILPAGFDAAAPNNGELMDMYDYLKKMGEAVPDVFEKIDGWTSHSYPNPGFSGSCYDTGRMSIAGYKVEMDFLRRNYEVGDLPVFITETGWRQDRLDENILRNNYNYAFNSVWSDKNVVVAAVFLLNGQSGFDEFSLLVDGGQSSSYKALIGLSKIKGRPVMEIDKGSVAGINKERDENDGGVVFNSKKTIEIREKLSDFFKFVMRIFSFFSTS